MILHIMMKSSLALLLGLQVVSFQMCQSAAAIEEKRTQTRSIDTKKVMTQPLKLLPVDEGPTDPSFAEFRRGLLTALQNQDERFVLSILDDRIINGHDTERGSEQFRKQWELDQPDSMMWDILTEVLKLGGSFRGTKEGREFCAPYVMSTWPSVWDKLPEYSDFLEYYVITAKDLPMRAEPNSNSATVATLTYDVVKIPHSSSFNDRSGWTKVTTVTGQEGYVPYEYVRSAGQHHACFKKIRGQWLMTVFAALE